MDSWYLLCEYGKGGFDNERRISFLADNVRGVSSAVVLSDRLVTIDDKLALVPVRPGYWMGGPRSAQYLFVSIVDQAEQGFTNAWVPRESIIEAKDRWTALEAYKKRGEAR